MEDVQSSQSSQPSGMDPATVYMSPSNSSLANPRAFPGAHEGALSSDTASHGPSRSPGNAATRTNTIDKESEVDDASSRDLAEYFDFEGYYRNSASPSRDAGPPSGRGTDPSSARQSSISSENSGRSTPSNGGNPNAVTDQSSLVATKKSLNHIYHPIFDVVVTKYETIHRNWPLAVMAGYDWLRPDIHSFIEKQLSHWMRKGLWPLMPSFPKDIQDIEANCSLDMLHSGMKQNPATQKMLRRFSRVRLFYWYERLVNNDSQRRSLAANHLLKHFYRDWEYMGEQTQRICRNRFRAVRSKGKRWAQLVRYLSPGILVICGEQMDTQMNNNSFPFETVQALATLLKYLFPKSSEVCQQFDEVANTFLRKGVFSNQQYNAWYSRLNRQMLEYSQNPDIESAQSSVWRTVQDRTDDNLALFIQKALQQDQLEGSN